MYLECIYWILRLIEVYMERVIKVNDTNMFLTIKVNSYHIQIVYS